VKLFSTEVFGGILLGAIFGSGTFLLLRSIDDYEIEVLITLACVMGGYSLANYLHLSAPLAVVVAGLMVGNDTVRGTVMSQQTELYVDKFWELIDIMLNAVLFVLIGLELLVIQVNPTFVWAAVMAIVFVLLARFLSLLLPIRFFAKRLDFAPHTTTIMAWGGLRGGISIALALSLNAEMNRDLFLTVTYGVVIFSIIVQGLTVGPLARRLIGIHDEPEAGSGSA
jgi:CPA1 family monovalent cation:H+ antiporter